MNFLEYQIESRKTAIYPNLGNNYIYPVLGLCGESGEIAEKFKKIIRDKNGVIDEETKDSIKKEIGDVLWYVANICSELNIDLNDVAKLNIDKLNDRKNRNKIQGDGDDR